MDAAQAAATGTLLHQLAIVLAVDQFLDGAFRCCIIGTFCFHRALSGDSGQVVIDGIFGNATEAAVRDFQSSHGLYCDGIAGCATFGELAA